jgi:Ca2+-binding EF-hand superfamily protein
MEGELAEGVLRSIFVGEDGSPVHVEFADWAFLESLLAVRMDKLILALQLFSNADGTISKDNLRRALKGVLRMVLSLETSFWKDHFGKDDQILTAANVTTWKRDLEYFLRMGKFLQYARVDDPVNRETISATSFGNILVSRGSFNVTRSQRSNINSLSIVLPVKVSADEYMHFQTFVSSLPQVGSAMRLCSSKGRIARPDFEKALLMSANLKLPSHIVDIVFHVFNDPNALGMIEVESMLSTLSKNALELSFVDTSSAGKEAAPQGIAHHATVVAKSFSLGGVAGAGKKTRKQFCYF